MGMLFASIFMLYGREAWNTANLLQEPVYFLSGAYFPRIYAPVVPFALQAAGSLIPMTIGLDAIRRLAINGESIVAVWPHILALIACTLILFPLARRALNYMESLGKKEGRLTLRWQ
jgi:ABC-2 type transport system permease protein